jgi:membrane protease YdiL (CAAX protease family)
MRNSIKIITGFVILFLLYHAAEYMIMFKNSTTGFLAFQALFFLAAWLIGKWQAGNGFTSWGLSYSPRLLRSFIAGMVIGILLYGVNLYITTALGAETVRHVPGIGAIFIKTLPFALGVFFSSLSEDIFTRGYIYHHGYKKISTGLIILLSATVYLLNHIYKIGKGPEAWLYIFCLGLLFIIPVIITGRLWFTGAMHWAGNTLFFITHGVIDTATVSGHISPNYVFCGTILLFIPLTYWVLKALKLQRASYV